MKKIIFILFTIALVFGCNNDDDSLDGALLNGTYSGTFTVEYINSTPTTNPVSVTFSGANNYTSTGRADFIPAGGNGSYEVMNSTITFNDVNSWSSNFDNNLVLDGEYEFSLIDNQLTITASRNLGDYTYTLTKE